jgi:peptidoglycan hydrolase-like protein with peptidoglycan-binding domain
VSAAPVTTSTVAHTVSSTTAPAVTRHRTLRYGMHGSDVAAIQRRLHVTADGAFGAQTRRAVNRFKAAHGLRADGIVGRHMWRLLGW